MPSNTLYLHGLDSELSEDKRYALERHTRVFAPKLDYRSLENPFDTALKLATKQNIDFVVGSSMGGFLGYYVSWALGKAALLFNPALPYTTLGLTPPTISEPKDRFLKIILGGKDDIIDPKDNFNWILQNEQINYDVKFISQLGHQIPLDVFEREVEDFFKSQGIK